MKAQEIRSKLEAARKNLKEVNQSTMLFTGKNFEKAEVVVNEILALLDTVEVLGSAAKETVDDGMKQGVKFGNLAYALSLYEQGSVTAPGSALNEAKARLMRAK